MNRQQKDEEYNRLSFIESAKTEAEWANYRLAAMDRHIQILTEISTSVEAARTSKDPATRHAHLLRFDAAWAQATEFDQSHLIANRRILADHDRRIRDLQVRIYGDAVAPPR